MTQNITKAVTYALLTSCLVGFVSAGTKYLSEIISLHTIICSQYLVGFAFALPRLLKKDNPLTSVELLPLHFLRAISGLSAFYAFYFTLTQIPLVDATLLRSSAPLCVPIVLLVWRGIRIPNIRWLPLSIGFIGVLIILKPNPSNISPWHLVGFASAIFLAISMVCTRLLIKTESNDAVVFYYFAIALVITLPLAIMNWTHVPWSVWPMLLGVGGLFYLSMQTYTYAFRYAKPSIISPVSYFGVVFAGLLGWLFWEQIPVISTYLGVAFVFSGALLTLWLEKNNGPAKKPSSSVTAREDSS